TPMSANWNLSVNGITANTINAGANAMTGARTNNGRSAAFGIVSSFSNNFNTSVTVWSNPQRPPTWFGPWRSCMKPMTFRSARMAYVTNPRTINSKTTDNKKKIPRFTKLGVECNNSSIISHPPPRGQYQLHLRWQLDWQ